MEEEEGGGGGYSGCSDVMLAGRVGAACGEVALCVCNSVCDLVCMRARAREGDVRPVCAAPVWRGADCAAAPGPLAKAAVLCLACA